MGSSQRSWSDVVKFGAKVNMKQSTTLVPPPPDHIPEEITGNILSRLPIKSLLRFKCVCKFWNSIISDPGFSLSNPRSMAAFMSSYNKFHPIFRFIDSDGSIQRIPWKNTENRYIIQEYIAGSCNGLLLILIDSSFFLWNPSTRKFCKVLQIIPNYKDAFQHYISGFGYDPLTDDYKVVIGVRFKVRDSSLDRVSYYDIEHDYYILVAGLKDKVWKEIRFPYLPYYMTTGVLFNGFCHWICFDEVDHYDDDDYDDDLFHPKNGVRSNKIIIAFDLKTDKIHEVPLHPTKNKKDFRIINLGILDSCLCMTCWDKDTCLEGNVEVFVMREYGNQESWILLFDIRNSEINPRNYSFLMPLLVMKNGEVLMLGEETIFRYNPRTNKRTDLQVKGATTNSFHPSCNVFVESLSSPTGYGWDEKQHQDIILQRLRENEKLRQDLINLAKAERK